MAAQTPDQKLRPKRHGLGIGGVALFGTGGCLMWTIVLIPLAIPLALVGLVMAIGALFVKTEPFTCPACGVGNTVEPAVQVAQCPACTRTVRRTSGSWEVLP